MLIWGRIDQAEQICARNPDTSIIIDHLGIQQPRVPPAPKDAWAELPKVLKFAAHKNVSIKISGACTLSHEPFPYNDIWDPLARMFDAFGLDRCMWGTDWTRAKAVVDYKPAVDAFPRHRPAVGQRQGKADGRQPDEDLQLVAVEG